MYAIPAVLEVSAVVWGLLWDSPAATFPALFLGTGPGHGEESWGIVLLTMPAWSCCCYSVSTIWRNRKARRSLTVHPSAGAALCCGVGISIVFGAAPSAAQVVDTAQSVQQLIAMQRAWGRKTSSAGATLTLTEGPRSTANEHAVIRYRVNTSGLPKDKIYSLVMWQLGGQPRVVMNGVTIDETGTAVCAGAADKCRGDKPDDPIDLAMQAGLGETKRVGLIAADKSAQVFTSVVPFPNRAADGACALEASLVTPNAEAVMLSARGFKPGVDLDIEMNFEGEKQHPVAKTDGDGAYEWVVLPFKKGLTKGRAQVTVRADGCSPTLSFAWGAGSYALQ